MRFGTIPVTDCAGALLAHRLAVGDVRLPKGHVLTETDARILAEAGIAEVIALRLDPGDVPEDEAAALLGAALSGTGMSVGEASTGRVNVHAAAAGLFRVDRAAVDALNRIDPAITFACLADRVPVREGEMVATIKIIPLAAPGGPLEKARAVIAGPDFCAVKPFSPHRVGLVATRLPSLKESVMDKTWDTLQARLDASGSTLVREERVAHAAAAVASALQALAPESDMLVVFGASAVADEDDVIPAAIRRAGGHVESVGMPVDPGNLLVLGTIDGKPVLGAPGCARSPKENGFDWVLARLLAGEGVTRADIAGMGVGGLLTEIPTRPQPRSPKKGKAPPVRVDAVLLAAGRASRMGGEGGHKLLALFDGEPLVARAARVAADAPVGSLVVVTGHRAGEIEAALDGIAHRAVHNPDFSRGMASSLGIGIAALDGEAAGALVLLADMPAITAAHLRAMVAAFARAGGKAVVRAASGEKRGNPVILPRALFPAVLTLRGDIGARGVVEASGLPIIDVDIGPAAEIDVDTPEAVRAAGGVPAS